MYIYPRIETKRNYRRNSCSAVLNLLHIHTSQLLFAQVLIHICLRKLLRAKKEKVVAFQHFQQFHDKEREVMFGNVLIGDSSVCYVSQV